MSAAGTSMTRSLDELEHLFRARLIEAMAARNMGAASLTKVTGIPKSTIYHWLRPDGPIPPLGDLRRELVAGALRVNLGWLNGLDEQRDGDHDARAEDE